MVANNSLIKLNNKKIISIWPKPVLSFSTLTKKRWKKIFKTSIINWPN